MPIGPKDQMTLVACIGRSEAVFRWGNPLLRLELKAWTGRTGLDLSYSRPNANRPVRAVFGPDGVNIGDDSWTEMTKKVGSLR